MNTHTWVPPTVASGIRGTLAVLTVVGVVGFLLIAMLSFEEPNTAMLFVSGVLVLAAPIAALLHLWFTPRLTDDEKKIWLREFGSGQAWSALSEYLSSTNLSESARRRAQNALVRRESK